MASLTNNPFGAAASAAALLLLLLLAPARASPADALVALTGSIALPGVHDALDAMKLDHSVLVGNLLFLACKENNTVSVVDLDAGAFVTSTPVQTPQGVAFSAALGAVVVASSGAGAVVALRASAPFDVLYSVSVGADCDNIRVRDAADGRAAARAWVGCGGGAAGPGSVSAVDLTQAGGAVAFSMDVGGDHPEELNLSPLRAALTVSVPSAPGGGGVRVLSTDPAHAATLDYFAGEGRWANPFAQTLDASGQVLWVGSGGTVDPPVTSQLLALNALDGSILFAAPSGDAGAGADEIAVDAAGGLVFAAKGGAASRLYVVQQTSAPSNPAFVAAGGANWTYLGSLDGMPQNLVNARGVVFRASTRTLYVKVPLAAANNQSAQLLVFSVAAAAPGGGGGGSNAAQQYDVGPLSQGGWSALSAGVFLVGLLAGILLTRNVASLGGGGKKEGEGGDVYAGLN